MSRSALPFLALIPAIAVALIGIGLFSNRSWVFSLGFGLLLASVAVLITLRRGGRR